MSKYAIWNKTDNIITPIGEVLTPEQWIARYPVAGIESVTVVCAAGEVNGAFFGTLNQMVQGYESKGCDFSACTTPEEKLAAIEAFDKAKRAEAAAKIAEEKANTTSNEELTATSLASIAASLDYQNMMTLEDVEVTE